MSQIEQFNHLLYLKPFNCVQTNELQTIHLKIVCVCVCVCVKTRFAMRLNNPT